MAVVVSPLGKSDVGERVSTFSSPVFRPVNKVAKNKFSLRNISQSVRPSVCPHAITRLPPDGLSWNLVLDHFSKICLENSSFINPYPANVENMVSS